MITKVVDGEEYAGYRSQRVGRWCDADAQGPAEATPETQAERLWALAHGPVS